MNNNRSKQQPFPKIDVPIQLKVNILSLSLFLFFSQFFTVSGDSGVLFVSTLSKLIESIVENVN